MRRLMVTLLVAMVTLVAGSACAKSAPSPAPSPAPTAAPKPPQAPSPAAKVTPAPVAAVPMPWQKWPVDQIPAAWGWPEFFITNGQANYYADAVAMAELVKKYSGIKTQVVQLGTGVKGVNAALKGDALLNLVDAAVINAAFLGVRDFQGTKPGIAVGIATSDTAIQEGMYVRRGSGIRTPSDLKGKRIAYPAAIPLFSTQTDAILKAYGMTRSDIKEVPYTATDGLPALMRQNQVDMFIYTIAPGTAMATEMTTTGDAYLIGIDPDKIDAAEKATGGLYPKAVLPAGSYKGQDKDILTLSNFMLMHTRSDLPESLAYTVTRILWEHIEEFRSMGSSASKMFLTPKGAVAASYIMAGFHPGAIRYYKEKGVWGAEQDKVQQNFEAQLKAKLAAPQTK